MFQGLLIVGLIIFLYWGISGLISDANKIIKRKFNKKNNVYSIRTDPIPLTEIKPEEKPIIGYTNLKKELNNKNLLLEELYNELITVCEYQSTFQDRFFYYLNREEDTDEIIEQLPLVEKSMLQNDKHILYLIDKLNSVSIRQDSEHYTNIIDNCKRQSIILNEIHSLLIFGRKDENETPVFDQLNDKIKLLWISDFRIKEASEKINENKLIRHEINGYPEVKSLLNKISLKDKVC